MSYSDVVLADSPVMYLPLQESLVATNAGSGVDFTYQPGVVTEQPPLVADGGTAVHGSGTSAIAIADSIPAGLTGSNVTLEAWIDVPAAGAKGSIITLGATSVTGWGWYIGGSNPTNVGKQLFIASANQTWGPTGYNFTTGTHHVAIVRGSGTTLTAYVDGASVWSGNLHFAVSTPSGKYGVGLPDGGTGAASAPSAGLIIDNAAIYDSALSGTRIAAHAAATTNYPTEVLADNPIVFLRFDEALGAIGTTADASGNGHTGLLTGAVVAADTTDPAAPVALGEHVRLDGASGHVLLDGGSWFDPASAGFTFEGWYYVRSWPNWARIFDFGADLYFGANNVGSMWLHSAGTSLATSRFVTAAWHHVVATVSTAGAAVIYVDGTAVASGDISAPTGGSRTKYIGKSAFPDPYLPASVTQVALYHSVLTSTQVTAHYAAGTTVGPTPAAGSLASTLPSVTASLLGTYSPPTRTGSLAATLPAIDADLVGTYTPPVRTGSLAVTLPAVTASLTGTYIAPDAPLTGTLAATLSTVTAALAGAYTPPAIAGATGSLAATLPALAATIAGTYVAPPPTQGTDTLNRANGRTRSGKGYANLDEPVTPKPATIHAEPIRIMSQTLSTPTLEKGRPV